MSVAGPQPSLPKERDGIYVIVAKRSPVTAAGGTKTEFPLQ